MAGGPAIVGYLHGYVVCACVLRDAGMHGMPLSSGEKVVDWFWSVALQQSTE